MYSREKTRITSAGLKCVKDAAIIAQVQGLSLAEVASISTPAAVGTPGGPAVLAGDFKAAVQERMAELESIQAARHGAPEHPLDFDKDFDYAEMVATANAAAEKAGQEAAKSITDAAEARIGEEKLEDGDADKVRADAAKDAEKAAGKAQELAFQKSLLAQEEARMALIKAASEQARSDEISALGDDLEAYQDAIAEQIEAKYQPLIDAAEPEEVEALEQRRDAEIDGILEIDDPAELEQMLHTIHDAKLHHDADLLHSAVQMARVEHAHTAACAADPEAEERMKAKAEAALQAEAEAYAHYQKQTEAFNMAEAVQHDPEYGDKMDGEHARLEAKAAAINYAKETGSAELPSALRVALNDSSFLLMRAQVVPQFNKDGYRDSSRPRPKPADLDSDFATFCHEEGVDPEVQAMHIKATSMAEKYADAFVDAEVADVKAILEETDEYQELQKARSEHEKPLEAARTDLESTERQLADLENKAHLAEQIAALEEKIAAATEVGEGDEEEDDEVDAEELGALQASVDRLKIEAEEVDKRLAGLEQSADELKEKIAELHAEVAKHDAPIKEAEKVLYEKHREKINSGNPDPDDVYAVLLEFDEKTKACQEAEEKHAKIYLEAQKAGAALGGNASALSDEAEAELIAKLEAAQQEYEKAQRELAEVSACLNKAAKLEQSHRANLLQQLFREDPDAMNAMLMGNRGKSPQMMQAAEASARSGKEISSLHTLDDKKLARWQKMFKMEGPGGRALLIIFSVLLSKLTGKPGPLDKKIPGTRTSVRAQRRALAAFLTKEGLHNSHVACSVDRGRIRFNLDSEAKDHFGTYENFEQKFAQFAKQFHANELKQRKKSKMTASRSTPATTGDEAGVMVEQDDGTGKGRGHGGGAGSSKPDAAELRKQRLRAQPGQPGPTSSPTHTAGRPR
jgi:hypothetical protein